MSSPVRRRARRVMPIALFLILASLVAAAAAAPVAAAAGWEVTSTGYDQWIEHVTAVGPSEAWAEASTPSSVWHTTDGSDWGNTGTANLSGDLEVSSFFDPTHGLVANSVGQVSYTTDGSNWSSPVYLPLVPPSPTNHYRAYDISFGDAQTAWIAPFDQSAILKTTDGGATWSDPAETVPAGVTPDIVAAVSATTCWAADGSHVIETINGGTTWTQTAADPPVPAGAYIFGIAASDADHLWVVGGDNATGFVLATSDGASTWATQLDPGACYGRLDAVDVLPDGTHGWAVSTEGVVLRTADGGSTWVPQVSGTDKILLDVSFYNARNGWAVGTQGTILHTTDGGGTPDTAPPVTIASLKDGAWVGAFDNTVQLTATDTGVGVWKIQYKVDGAATWAWGWTPTTVTIPTATQGAHTVQYQALDKGGNTEAIKTLHVNVDTVAPTVTASKRITTKKRKVVTVKFRITDPKPCGTVGAAEIAIFKAKSSGSGPVMPLKDFQLKNKKVNTTLRFKFKCTLKKGKYQLWTAARDQAGNWCAKDAVTKLTVT